MRLRSRVTTIIDCSPSTSYCKCIFTTCIIVLRLFKRNFNIIITIICCTDINTVSSRWDFITLYSSVSWHSAQQWSSIIADFNCLNSNSSISTIITCSPCSYNRKGIFTIIRTYLFFFKRDFYITVTIICCNYTTNTINSWNVITFNCNI